MSLPVPSEAIHIAADCRTPPKVGDTVAFRMPVSLGYGEELVLHISMPPRLPLTHKARARRRSQDD